jgi:hypothetical protein
MKPTQILIGVMLLLMAGCAQNGANTEPEKWPDQLFEYNGNLEPRWSSFENITAEKGKGGMENNGAKGHPYERIPAGETTTLLDVEGAGMINRIWVTISDRSPEMLRSLKLQMFWDGAGKPAVEVPFGDFFGVGLGRTARFESALFANPEGRSFNSFVSMPFREGALVQITNESENDLDMIFFDIDFQRLNEWDDNYLYFHSYWHRDTATTLAGDFEILPRLTGRGRFIGTNIGVNLNPAYQESWWGEGEVKIYLDGDDEFATLVGTGTEDYIGTAYGQGVFSLRFNGCLIGDSETKQWAFYRYHIPDPIFFHSDCRVTIQQMGGWPKEQVKALMAEGVDLIPVTVQNEMEFHRLYEPGQVNDLEDPNLPDGWTNFFRSDDVSATAYFYLATPVSNLPALQPVEMRTVDLRSQ